MNNSVVKAAIKFLKKDIKKRADFKSVANFLKSKGYAVIFYNHGKGNELIDKYNLSEYSKTVDAFTFRRNNLRIVFINGIVSTEDKLYLLLHETGHIILEHLSEDKLISNNRVQDIEADTFAYAVLNPPKRNHFFSILLVCIIASLGFASGTALSSAKMTVTEPMHNYVYITPSGEKYHRESCIYINRTASTAVTEAEAKRTHEPCLVCNP